MWRAPARHIVKSWMEAIKPRMLSQLKTFSAPSKSCSNIKPATARFVFYRPPFRCIGSCRSCLSIGSEHQRIFNISSVVAARAGFLRKGARDMKCVVELIHGNVLQPLKKPRELPRGGRWDGGETEPTQFENKFQEIEAITICRGDRYREIGLYAL